MYPVERKLAALTSVLTARQRAILGTQKWVNGEYADERLERMCPPQDKAEMEAIRRAVLKGNNDINQAVVFMLEWLANMELEVHWLRTLEMYQRRERALPHPIKRGLGPLPVPWDTRRQAHRGFGASVETGEPVPARWEEFSASLAEGLKRALNSRWQECLHAEASIEEASRALGTSVVHQEIRKNLDHLEAAIRHVAGMLVEAGHDFQLPDYDAHFETWLGEAFNLDVLREVPEKHPREYLHERGLAELEEWEREQIALLDEE